MHKLELKEVYKSSLYDINKFIKEEKIDSKDIINLAKTISGEYYMVYADNSVLLNISLYPSVKMKSVTYGFKDTLCIGQIIRLPEDLQRELHKELLNTELYGYIQATLIGNLDKEYIVSKINGINIELKINSHK
jgi:hypothetical protein